MHEHTSRATLSCICARFLFPGPDPGRCNRCKCIGHILPQIIRKSTFCENTRSVMRKFQQSYFFLEMTTTHILNLHLKGFFPKTCPRTITLTFLPLIYTAMFQNLLFNDVHIKSFIFDFVYVFESACIKMCLCNHTYIRLPFICEI